MSAGGGCQEDPTNTFLSKRRQTPPPPPQPTADGDITRCRVTNKMAPVTRSARLNLSGD